MGRSRSKSHKDLAAIPNLYRNADGYYFYCHPVSKEKFGLGKNKAIAVTQALQANLHFQKQAVTLLDRITGSAERTVSDWCDEYERLNGKNERIKYVREGIGHHVLEKLEPLQISEWLDRWNDKLRMRQAMLGIVKGIFAEAIGKGWIKANPASELRTPSPVTKRERLTLEAFKAIHAASEPPLQRAMELAIMTCARRENVIKLGPLDIKDGHLHIVHIKDGLMVRYPLSLYLADVGWTLGDVIARCRTNVLSRFFIHHQRHAGRAKPGDKFRDKTIEQMFRDARLLAGISGENPPTFHEIRSLAIRLWDARGYDAKKMAGHKTDKSSALYKDSRGTEWVTVSA